MAGDRHGKHNTTTISFRVNSYEKATIEERVKVSGMKKQDYIVRSCIYNHVFIHDANTEAKKTELFGKVKSGQVRFLIGSTAKMGAGTNVQDRLIALHHLDIGWKPSDLERAPVKAS